MRNMMYFLTASAAALICSAALALLLRNRKHKSRRLLTPFSALAAGTLVSSFLLFLPIYGDYFSGSGGAGFKTALLALHNSIRLFVVDSDFDVIRDAVSGAGKAEATAFSCFAAVLYLLAPLLTYSFVLSLFKNASAYRKLVTGWFRPMYVFSDLNERSLALASSVRKNHRRALIVFTNTSGADGDNGTELDDSADDIGAVCFRKDIADVNLRLHRRRGSVSFFIMENDDAECLRKTGAVIKTHGKWPNAVMYVFSESDASAIAVASMTAPVDSGGKPVKSRLKMRVHRVNPYRSLLEENAYSKGAKLFRGAREVPGQDEKLISALVVGCGSYGEGMIKILAWLCQVDGYRVEINVIDSDPWAEKRFTASCPELMSAEHNGKNDKGESRYTIRFFSGIDAGSPEFSGKISELGDTTYAFVSLGGDEANIRCSVALRELFERMGIHPDIQSVVYDPVLRESMENAHISTGERYDIDFIGDLESCYSEKVICHSELERDALERHLRWGDESSFWSYEYNYRSSIASAIYRKTRRDIGVPGAGKDKAGRTEAQRDALCRMEHERWNTYMRSEGYVYSPVRSRLGKTHSDLVHYDLLPREKKNNDDMD